MISIKFSPKYEDRVSIFLKNSALKNQGITYDFKETPQGEYDFMCYWLFDYPTGKSVNTILRDLVEMKNIMGVDDLQLQYVHSEKEFYTQYNEGGSIPWFKV